MRAALSTLNKRGQKTLLNAVKLSCSFCCLLLPRTVAPVLEPANYGLKPLPTVSQINALPSNFGCQRFCLSNKSNNIGTQAALLSPVNATSQCCSLPLAGTVRQRGNASSQVGRKTSGSTQVLGTTRSPGPSSTQLGGQEGGVTAAHMCLARTRRAGWT